MRDKVKSSTILLREPIEELSEGYMMEMQQRDKTKKIYDVDPYAEVYQLRDNVYGILTQSADGMGDPWMYLIIGPEKAMLIDTSFGIGNLKGLCDEITGGMPLVVGNTHPSFDHSYGNAAFGRAYCHEYAVPYMQQQMNPHIWDYLFDPDGNPIWLNFDREDIIHYQDWEAVGLANHALINLGGDYDIELIHLPGHHAGHCGFLDRKQRLLFCGDVFLSMRVGIGGPRPNMPYNQYATVEALRNEMVLLAKRTDEIDRLFPGHFVLDIRSTVIPSMAEALDAIVKNPGAYHYKEKTPRGFQYFRFVKGLGTVAYNDNSVYMKGKIDIENGRLEP